MSNLKLRGPKVGFFSDIHIGLGQDSAVWHSNILEFARWVTDFYSKHGINEIIIPGDIFHNRNEISVNTLNKAKEFFDLFKDFKVYISTGNHDCYYKDRSDVNSISLLGGWNNIVLVDKTPQVLTIHNSDKTLSLIPWGTSVEDIPVSDICVGHFEIKTFRMNTYKECEHGMESNNLLAKSPFIISGHFHRRDRKSVV
jgi:predicted MPP superfamily phosphohydrolase